MSVGTNWKFYDDIRTFIERNQIEKLKQLYREGHKIHEINPTSMWVAVDTGKYDIVELLLDNGADPNSLYYKGYSVLERARRRGFGDIEKLLMNRINGSCCSRIMKRFGYLRDSAEPIIMFPSVFELDS